MSQDQDLKVKGSSIRSKLQFAREHFGAEAEKDLVKFLAESGVSQVLDGSWYPFSLFDALLVQIAERCYGGALERLDEVGRYSAKKALSGTYEIYSQMNFAYFLKRINALHKRFYSQGEIQTAMADNDCSCTIRMHGAPFYTDADLHVASGFYAGAAEVLGLEEVRCAMHRADHEVVFELNWK